ncbi:MAG: discoidin domain-containing protein, partial [Flavobacteriaceae bacterium]
MKKITFLIALMVFTFGQSQNLALSGTATGSNENQPASNAIDGNANTRWETDFSDPQWITIDLGASYDIGQVVLNWEGAFASSYEIQITDDATFATFATAYTTTTGDGGIDVLSVSETGRYVRMYGTVRGTVYGYSLWEFEIYEAVDPLTDATLSNLTVNGATVSGFSSNTLNYNVELPQGTTVVPTVAATTSQASPASSDVTNATSLPGTTSVLVTAQDGTTTNTYNINFTVQITPMSQTFDITFESGTT